MKIRKIKHSFFLVTTHARVHSWILMCPLALHAERPGQPHYIPDEETGCRGRGPRPESHRPRHRTQKLTVASYFTSAQLGSQETTSPPSHIEMVSEVPGTDLLFLCPKLYLSFPFLTPMTCRESAPGALAIELRGNCCPWTSCFYILSSSTCFFYFVILWSFFILLPESTMQK